MTLRTIPSEEEDLRWHYVNGMRGRIEVLCGILVVNVGYYPSSFQIGSMQAFGRAQIALMGDNVPLLEHTEEELKKWAVGDTNPPRRIL